MLVILMCLVHQACTIRVNYLWRYLLNAPGIIKLSARCMERLKSCWYFSSPRFTQVSANSEVTSHLIQSNINSREVGPAIGPELSLITKFPISPAAPMTIPISFSDKNRGKKKLDQLCVLSHRFSQDDPNPSYFYWHIPFPSRAKALL